MRAAGPTDATAAVASSPDERVVPAPEGAGRLLLVPMTREEWLDLQAVFCRRPVSEVYAVSVFSPHALYADTPFVQADPPPAGVDVIDGVNPTGRSFYEVARPLRILITLLNALRLAWYIRRHGVSVLVSGSPTLYVRLARSLSGRVRHLAFLRSAYPGIDRVWSDSEQWQQRFSRVGVTLPRALRPYAADTYLVSGCATVAMLLARGAERTQIHVAGPAALGVVRRERATPVPAAGPRRLMFVTQAFIRHGDQEAHECQLAFVRDLITRMAADDRFAPLVLRAHPRDDVRPYREIAQALRYDLQFDTRPASQLLREEPADTALCGATSTLLFEWAYVGGTSYAAARPALYRTYRAFFETIGAAPFTDAAALLDAAAAKRGGLPAAATSSVLALPGECDLDLLSPELLPLLQSLAGAPQAPYAPAHA